MKAFPITTPPYSKGFFILRNLRYAIGVTITAHPASRSQFGDLGYVKTRR